MSKRNKNTARHAAAPAPAVLPLGALAAGFGMMLVSGSALAQSGPVPTPPAPSASAPAEAVLPAVKVKAAAEESAKESLQTVTTTIGKGKQDIRDIPQSLTVMTEKLIDDVKLDTLKQALHYTAGITFAATENGTDQDIRMRGFPVATTGDLLIDGMKDPSQYDRDSFNYDRIEVLRGSSSMLFGRGSTGGVINQVTKKPVLADLNEVEGTLGTGESLRLTGDFNLRTGEESAVRINVMGHAADNHGASIGKRGIAPSVSWGIGTRDEFTLGLFYLKVENVPMSSLRYLNGSIAGQIPAKNFYGSASDYLRGEALYGSGIWTHRFDDGGELRTQFRTGTYRRAAWGTTAGYCALPLNAAGACVVPTGTPAVTSITSASQLTRSGLSPRADDITGSYAQSDYSNKFQWLGLRHEIITGIDLAYEAADRFTAFGPVGTNYNKGGTSVGTPDDGATTAATPAFRQGSDYAGRSFGAYAQDLVWLSDQWKVLGGLRYDRVKADMHSLTYPSATATTPSGATASQLSYPSLWSYRVGMLFQPTPFQSYHVSYGTSFNTSADTYQYTNQQTADVDAEKSRNIEVGAKLDWLDGALSTRLSLFRTEKYNERTTDSDFAGTFPVLSGKRHSQGYEIDVVGRVTPKVELYLSFSHMFEGQIDKVGTAVAPGIAGAAVGLTPRNTGALWASYQILPQLRIAGGVRGASNNRPLQGGTAAASSTASVPGYVAGDVMAEYTVSPDVRLQLNVNNVTDKVYGDQLYPGFYTPGEARSVKLSLAVRF